MKQTGKVIKFYTLTKARVQMVVRCSVSHCYCIRVVSSTTITVYAYLSLVGAILMNIW